MWWWRACPGGKSALSPADRGGGHFGHIRYQCPVHGSNVAVSLSGTISTKTGTDVDSDINDPQAKTNINNNLASRAQILNNFVTVSGYASAQGSFGTSRNLNDRFALAPRPR